MTDTPLWERLAGESARAYEAFVAYRDMGATRSLDKLAQVHPKNISTIRDWNRRYTWQPRVRAYDDYIDAQARAIIDADSIARRVTMIKRHAEMGRMLQAKGLEYLRNIGVDKASDAITAVKTGIDLERKSEGLPDYLLEVQTLSDDDLKRRYSELIAAFGSHGSGDDPPRHDAAAAESTDEDGET